MIKRLERWFASIFQKELAVARTEIAELRAELAKVHAELKEHTFSTAKDVQMHAESVASEIKERAELGEQFIKDHVSDAIAEIHQHVATDYESLLKHIEAEILKRYDTLVRDAAAAARVMDASKIAMAICDYCHLPKRRFATSRIDGKIVCSDCAAKGQN